MKQKYKQKLCDSLNRECEVYYSTWSAETRIQAVDKWMYEGQMLRRQMFWLSFFATQCTNSTGETVCEVAGVPFML